jgi:hypothetical protein
MNPDAYKIKEIEGNEGKVKWKVKEKESHLYALSWGLNFKKVMILLVVSIS